jgi:alkyldihydroxyacetonephosphate synthase
VKIYPEAKEASTRSDEPGNVWGFSDSGFERTAAGHVTLQGTRYALAGKALPDLWPFFLEHVGETLGGELPKPETPAVTLPRVAHPELERRLGELLGDGNVSVDSAARVRCGHGHTLDEVHALRHGGLRRIPDVVASPQSEDEVVEVVRLARELGACLVPYGGGTNVTHALLCPENETRCIIALSTRRMNRVRWIDPENRLAEIEAGAVGRHIVETLGRYGLVLGHEPDSIEFSTLGGWIATNASGMKKNRYGNIEEIVVDLRAVGSDGVISHVSALPRESIGTDVRRLFFGSEGNFGIITSAVVRVAKKPAVQQYGSFVFPDFQTGVAFLKALSADQTLPASVRLVDNLQFRLGQALKPKPSAIGRQLRTLQKTWLTLVKRFDLEQISACTIVYEGDEAEVNAQRARVTDLALDTGGIDGGAENGERGYQLTFGIAYLRDFALRHGVLAESMETTVPWTKILDVTQAVRRRVIALHQELGLPGRAFISCRISQLYSSGVCIYFYLAIDGRDLPDPCGSYAKLEHEARRAILENGGALSHHHGIGQIRKDYLPQILSEAALSWRQRTKTALDPEGVFGVGNQGLRSTRRG